MFLILVGRKVHHVYDDEAHSKREQQRLTEAGKEFEVMDTDRHSCLNFTGGAGGGLFAKCEGCYANHFLIEYLIRYTRGLNNQIGSLEEYKVDRPASRREVHYP